MRREYEDFKMEIKIADVVEDAAAPATGSSINSKDRREEERTVEETRVGVLSRMMQIQILNGDSDPTEQADTCGGLDRGQQVGLGDSAKGYANSISG